MGSELRVLNAARPSPFPVDDAIDTAEAVRLRYRYLDLRRPRMFKNLWLRHRLAARTRDYLNANGFIEVETPMLTRSTPEGARDYLVPSRVNPGTFFALPQSPQLFKQILMVAGVDRYYQIARCFRDEDLRADRQPEFTQIDLEMSFLGRPAIFRLMEGLVAELFAEAGIPMPAPPLPVLSYAEAIARFGTRPPRHALRARARRLRAASSRARGSRCSRTRSRRAARSRRSSCRTARSSRGRISTT